MKDTEEIEKQHILEALKYVNSEMYIDAIKMLKKFTEEYKESKYIDDVYYNIALCYYEIKDFTKSIIYFDFVIRNYPNSDIDSFSNREFGKTAAKCHLGIINCYLILNETDKIQNHLNSLLKFNDSSYILDNSENRLTFYEIAKQNIELKKRAKL
tara:strand:- start:1812 stop:2276 length:465 start_codon:yes stop_codon:yes gene_type:complete